MNEDEQVNLRCLPQGPAFEARICSAEGSKLELQLGSAAEIHLGDPVEIKTPELIYLGVVERQTSERIWLNVEHVLDRKILANLQTTWKENDAWE